MNYFFDFVGLIFPSLCIGCGNPLWINEKIICTFCSTHLPKTNFHLEKENPLTHLFYGRCPIEGAAACLFFNKGNRAQKLIHALKYKGRKEVGIWLGFQYGNELATSSFIKDINLIIPIPLHERKLKSRGFNQSEQFALGLGSALQLPVETELIIRKKETETQTRKSRFSRWQNVEDIFDLRDICQLEGKHILLVDDVITTGATLESCALTLQRVRDVRISIAAIAVSSR